MGATLMKRIYRAHCPDALATVVVVLTPSSQLCLALIGPVEKNRVYLHQRFVAGD